MRKKYISKKEDSGSEELNLYSFLNDFVIEMGPLKPEDHDGGGSSEVIELLAPEYDNTTNSSSMTPVPYICDRR